MFSGSLRYCVRSTLPFFLPVAGLASSAAWPIWDCSSLSWNLMYAIRSASSLLTLTRDCWLCRSTQLHLLSLMKHPFQSTIVPVPSSIRHFCNWLLFHFDLCNGYRSLHIRLLKLLRCGIPHVFLQHTIKEYHSSTHNFNLATTDCSYMFRILQVTIISQSVDDISSTDDM